MEEENQNLCHAMRSQFIVRKTMRTNSMRVKSHMLQLHSHINRTVRLHGVSFAVVVIVVVGFVIGRRRLQSRTHIFNANFAS